MTTLQQTGRRSGLAALVLAALVAGAMIWVLSATAQSPPPPPPDSPTSVSVTRSDGNLTASWNSPNGATKYHITYSSDSGASWSMAASAHTSNSITITGADNSKTYIVGVRAGNDQGWSGWVNSASAGPYTPTPPGSVASVTVTRDDGTLNASWDAVNGATSYHITYMSGEDRIWLLAALNHTSNSITISGIENSHAYKVGVRARNAHGDSGWVNSAPAAPFVPPTPVPTPTPTPEPTPTPVPVPARPTGLTAAAGDGSVTLTWDTPSDPTIRDYAYQMNHNDTGSGRFSGWGEWKYMLISETNTTSHTVTGLTNGKEYRFKLVAVNTGGGSKPAPNAAPWYVAATPTPPPPPPDAPANVQVTPNGNTLDITWDAVSGATSYELRAKPDGGTSWVDVATGVTETSYSYTPPDTINYIGVRARNDNGVSAWTDISRMPSSDWLRTVQQSGASAQSVQPLAKLNAPSWGTITRRNTRPHALYLNWTAVTGATGYNVVCSDTDGWDWWQCGSINSGTTTTLTVDSDEEEGGTLGRYRSYKLSVRAVTGNASDASDWVNSVNIRPVVGNLSNLVATRGNGSITPTWTPNPWTTGYNIDCAVPASGQVADYTHCATLTGQDDTATSHTATVSSWTAGGTNYTIDNTKTYDIQIISTNAWGQARTEVPLVHPITLMSSRVTATSATLTLRNYSGSWWLKPTAPADAACKSMGTAATESLSDLKGGTTYTYKAYSDSSCANEIVSVTFTALSYPSVSNLSETTDGFGVTVGESSSAATGFTTGAPGNGYTLRSVTIDIRLVRSTRPQDTFTVAVHEESGGNPATNATHTLSGIVPTAVGEYTYTCSGTCTLNDGTPYYVVLTSNAESSTTYSWDTTASAAQTNTPSNFGWSIADGAHWDTGSGWAAQTGWTGIFKVSATPNPILTSSNVAGTSATLTIANHNGDWYYKADAAPHTTCQGPVSGTSTSLAGLSAGTSYTYTAYSDSACTTANELATAGSFTTP